MKKIKSMVCKVLLIMMSVILTTISFVACGAKNDVVKGEFGLNIITINKGYGLDWLNALVEEFKKKYPGIEVKVKAEVNDGLITNLLDSGNENNPYDLFFTGTNLSRYIKSSLNGSNEILADLTDLYNGKAAESETKTIKEKVDPSLLDAFTHKKNGEEKFYTMPIQQSINGLLYNNEAISAVMGKNWQKSNPIRTTDELLNFNKKLSGTKLKSYIYAAETSYYQILYNAWGAQYAGMDEIDNFFNGLAYDPTSDKMTVNKGIFSQQWRLEAMKVMESIMKKPYVVEESQGIDWNEAQTYFMAGRAAFFPNGDWNNIEMAKLFPENDIRFMKVPIISALGSKLGITEEELRLAVDYADALLDTGTATAPTISPKAVGGITLTPEEVLEKVVEARRIVDTYANQTALGVRAGSIREFYAKEFLKFMVSDRGQDISAKAMKGNSTLAYGYDISESEWFKEATEYAKSRFAIAKSTTYYYFRYNSYLGTNLNTLYRAIYSAPLEHQFYKLGKTAQDIVNVDINYYNNGDNWANLIEHANMESK